jgi:DNA replication protein DnaC
MNSSCSSCGGPKQNDMVQDPVEHLREVCQVQHVAFKGCSFYGPPGVDKMMLAKTILLQLLQ